MRRYTVARNPIEQIRERFGLADAPDQVAPPRSFIPGDSYPLPLVARAKPDPYFWPLPAGIDHVSRSRAARQRGYYDRPVLDNPALPSDSGAVDYNARQRTQLDTVPKGETVEPVSVYPAWESRLEGMRDFLPVLEGIPPDYETTLVATPGPMFMTAFVVPQGFTAFWKQFRFFFEPVPAVLTPLNTLITLIVDDTPIPHYTNLPLGGFMASYQDTFVIAAEGRRLTLRIDFADLGGMLDIATFVPRALLYGNLRPRTGESEWRDVGVRMPEPPPPPVAVIAPPVPSGPSWRNQPRPAMPGTRRSSAATTGLQWRPRSSGRSDEVRRTRARSFHHPAPGGGSPRGRRR